MKLFPSKRRVHDPLKVNTPDEWLVTFALNIVAFLIVLSAVFVLSLQAHAKDLLSPTRGWNVSTGTTGMMYFKLPFHADAKENHASYGFALTQSPGTYRSENLMLSLDAPKLVDLQFSGNSLKDVRLSNRSMMPRYADGDADGFGGFIESMDTKDWALAIGGTALAVWGITELADGDDDDDDIDDDVGEVDDD